MDFARPAAESLASKSCKSFSMGLVSILAGSRARKTGRRHQYVEITRRTGRIDRRGRVLASDFLIEPGCDILQTPLDRGERLRRRGAFDLPTGFREKLGHLGGLELGSGTYGKSLDAVRQLADLALQPFKRRRAQSSRGEEIAHFLGLPAYAFKGLRLYRCRSKAIDLDADRPNLAFEPGSRRLRVMRFQRRVELGGHRLSRNQHRFAMTALTHHFDPLHEIADGAFKRDDRVARREIGEAPPHGLHFGAHGA